MFLYLSAAQRFLSSLTSMLAFSFNYLDVVILGKAAVSTMVCLPSKWSPLPLYLCGFISTSHSIFLVPLFAIPYFHSLVLFLSFSLSVNFHPNPLTPLEKQVISSFISSYRRCVWNCSIKIFGVKAYPCGSVSAGHPSRGVSLARCPWPSHQVKPGSVSYVPYPTCIPGQLRLWEDGLRSLARSGNGLVFQRIYFKKSIWGMKI